jgi:hypothetical protein
MSRLACRDGDDGIGVWCCMIVMVEWLIGYGSMVGWEVGSFWTEFGGPKDQSDTRPQQMHRGIPTRPCFNQDQKEIVSSIHFPPKSPPFNCTPIHNNTISSTLPSIHLAADTIMTNFQLPKFNTISWTMGTPIDGSFLICRLIGGARLVSLLFAFCSIGS